MTITHTLSTPAGIDVLWALTLDVERWPQLSPTMTSVEKLEPGPMRVGSRAKVRQPGQGERVWEVTELLDTPQLKRFVWRNSLFVGGHEFASDGTGTRSTLTLETRGLLGGVLGILLRPVMSRAIAQENAGFAGAAEAMPRP